MGGSVVTWIEPFVRFAGSVSLKTAFETVSVLDPVASGSPVNFT